MELEWVFFSVTPTCGSASRMALLFTSSSRARSLIRTLLILPFLFSPLGLHRCLSECARTGSKTIARVMVTRFFQEPGPLRAHVPRGFRLRLQTHQTAPRHCSVLL